VVSLVAFSLAVALLIVHMLDGRVPRGYVLAAFVASAVIAAGDLREAAGETCTTVTAVTSGDVVTTCVVNYTVKVEALVALIASIALAMLTLVIDVLGRLGRAVGGWDV
jgi:hypothetical protein